MTDTGPSIRVVCRVLNQNSCGSGSICGRQPDGKSLVLTNAHVAGTRIGRTVDVEVESTGDRLQARVIMAAYSDRTVSDWAVLETLEPYDAVVPVYLSKKRPTGSHYTKGFPRCRPHAGTDIETVDFGSNGVWFWEPDAIGGQSGSGVWSDIDHLQYGLLTWQWGGHGAGQQTAMIYQQARSRNTAGFPRPDGLKELNDTYILEDSERGEDDPYVEPGFFVETSIVDLPIWAEDIPAPSPDPDPDPVPPGDFLSTGMFVEYLREVEELHEKWRTRLETQQPPSGGTNGGDSTGPTFGL